MSLILLILRLIMIWGGWVKKPESAVDFIYFPVDYGF